MNELSQCCTFWVNGLLFGVDVMKVREVIRRQDMTMIPLACEEIEGLINLRGEIVTAIDLRKRLRGTRKDVTQDEPMNVVVMTKDNPVSLLVDDVGDVIDIDAARVEEPPETLDKTARQLVDAVYKLEGKLMLILDVEASVDVRATL